MNKKLALIGSVGIPAKYGGFETLAEFLTKNISGTIATTVYCSKPAYNGNLQKTHNNARLLYIPLNANGIQSIPYDILSIVHALFYADILLILGVAGSFMFPLIRLCTKKRIVVNIDGLEHKREKWNKYARKYLKFSEKIAVKYAHVVIADNTAIQEYIKTEYGKHSVMIPYGADHIERELLTAEIATTYSLPEQYAFKVCRIEPENNIHLILEAFSQINMHIVIVGNWENSTYGSTLFQKYKNYKNIHLLAPIYNQAVLNQIRSHAYMYIHGHSAGGTNPSLVEAMYLGLPVIAFNVAYNRYTTNNKALYFTGKTDLLEIVNTTTQQQLSEIAQHMQTIAREHYTWSKIAQLYMETFQ